MNYYKKKRFNLSKFEAWGGAIETLELIEELNVMYQAEDYIEGMFYNYDIVTDKIINDFLWFKMDNFIKDMKQKIIEDTLEYFEYTGVIHGVLYAIESNNNLELVTEGEEGNNYIICYSKLDRDSIYTEDDRLHIVNKYTKQVSIYKVIDERLFLEKNNQL